MSQLVRRTNSKVYDRHRQRLRQIRRDDVPLQRGVDHKVQRREGGISQHGSREATVHTYDHTDASILSSVNPNHQHLWWHTCKSIFEQHGAQASSKRVVAFTTGLHSRLEHREWHQGDDHGCAARASNQQRAEVAGRQSVNK